tara:strand:- start:208 stop:549 length:342 start_codon:yes stop_codon:yes gene_type:complete
MLGKHKGNRFEILIYKDLRELGVCKRSIGSGSSDEAGDILFKHYAIECKHLKVVRWSALTNFWDKLKREITNDREPIIIFRQNREPIMVMCIMDINGKSTRAITSYNIWKQTI